IRLSDKIAYINHDIDDAIRAHIIKEEDIPYTIRNTLGFSIKERLNNLVHDIVINSENQKDVLMSKEMEEAMFSLRRFMFESVYTNPIAKGQEGKAENIVAELYEFYLKHLELLTSEYQYLLKEEKEPIEQVVCDYIAGMSDRFAIDTYTSLKIPNFWNVK
ncbi:MAG: dGTPase, partial [Clostridiales bacterium]|nr:dGTPase [Clostridiales bacterium]